MISGTGFRDQGGGDKDGGKDSVQGLTKVAVMRNEHWTPMGPLGSVQNASQNLLVKEQEAEPLAIWFCTYWLEVASGL